ncbi:hypothetical protein CC1G_09616 [Coprinopsis cinerea okayama7|uniref:Protein-S-isoprenylcysteine O-methyltransferase n=1 Tax=Coprinopsis cinerea (strain Okayama-7 / 130 / ATCC MYA-4618 / FGSC 9003) TaxID=240176 RepID=A8N4D2_COPC7|nr:hypothetical protein CC1G_09616 [Coprinopsis cinerea okayama7\|eukprot:XP_001829727.1 hypothetical protein CC1G_09616 [Coprinopsis cinerea okayama7\
MSLTRVVLVLVQAFCNGLACTPPNPTSPKQRYHTEEMYILQIAPLIFKCHQIICWGCALFEVLHYLAAFFQLPTVLPAASSLVCLAPQANIRLTPMFIIGVLSVVLGCYIRLDCFKTLGNMFTFDLTVHPEHRLVTNRFYSYVRHPAYTGSMMLVIGLAFSHLTRGSWLTECGPLRNRAAAIVVWAVWWLWTFCVGISRADAEDKQMRKLFEDEWTAYAQAVPWWFFPGLV